MFWWPEHEKTMKIASSCGQNIENLWKSRLVVARTCGKSQNFEVLAARTWKNYENRVFWWPEEVEKLKISMFWWPEHEKTMKIASSCGQNIENLWKSRLSWVSCPISVYGLLNTQLSDKYLYLYLAQLKPFKRAIFLTLPWSAPFLN